MSYEPPLKITIPIPSEIPKGFGPNSTGKRGGNLRVRCTNREYDTIAHEASLIGVTLAMFTRWSAIHVAKMLAKHRDEQSTSMAIGDEETDARKPKRKSKARRKTK
jgi:hypothetical protein